MYEICNEPNGDIAWDDVYGYAFQVIPVIRKNSPQALILVGTPDFSTNLATAMEKPLPYENIMYTLRCNKQETHSVILSDVDKKSGWNGEHLSISGQIVFDAF